MLRGLAEPLGMVLEGQALFKARLRRANNSEAINDDGIAEQCI